MSAKTSLTRGRKAKADAFVRQGEIAAARDLLLQLSRVDRWDVEIWGKLAFLERRLGRFPEAVAAALHVQRLRPQLALGWFEAAAARHCLGELDAAEAGYRQAIALMPTLADAHYLLGNLLHDRGRLPGAIAAYRAALRCQPKHADATADLGAALLLAGESAAAEAMLRAAIRLRPGAATTLANLAVLEEQRGRVDAARALYEQALRADAADPAIPVKQAALFERTGDVAAAEAALARLVGDAAGRLDAAIVRARLARRGGDADTAIGLLRAGLERGGGAADEGEALLMLGQLLDPAGQEEAALAAIEAGNARLAGLAGIALDASPPFLATVAEARTMQHGAARTPVPARADGPGSDPVFLVGFPRSGTTLLEQVLDSHPGIQTMEEKPAVAAMREAMRARGRTRLDALDDADVGALRAAYHEEAARHMARNPTLLLVDKMPLNALWLPLIGRVFPGARIILALRHPCDVCLSCVMQNFAANAAMASFYSLRHAAETYAGVMGLLDEWVAAFPRPVHRIRYEDVVTDLPGEARRLLDYLGVAWDPVVLDPARHARTRPVINTPSYHQVVRPVYRSALARWRRYPAAFAPVLPLLDPFIRNYRYASPGAP